MIPYNILIAALLTLYIIIAEIFTLSKDVSNKTFLSIICGLSAFFWTLGLAPFPFNIVISFIASIAAYFVYYTRKDINVANVESNNITSANEEKVFDTFPYKGWEGEVIYTDGTEQYIGVLDNTGDSIVVHSDDKMSKNDRFVIKNTVDGKIYVDKK